MCASWCFQFSLQLCPYFTTHVSDTWHLVLKYSLLNQYFKCNLVCNCIKVVHILLYELMLLVKFWPYWHHLQNIYWFSWGWHFIHEAQPLFLHVLRINSISMQCSIDFTSSVYSWSKTLVCMSKGQELQQTGSFPEQKTIQCV